MGFSSFDDYWLAFTTGEGPQGQVHDHQINYKKALVVTTNDEPT